MIAVQRLRERLLRDGLRLALLDGHFSQLVRLDPTQLAGRHRRPLRHLGDQPDRVRRRSPSTSVYRDVTSTPTPTSNSPPIAANASASCAADFVVVPSLSMAP
jgi:hypothetical protein